MDDDEKDVLIECVNLVQSKRKVSETTVQDVFDRMEDDDDDNDNDEELTTTTIAEETLVMVGCRDGSLREFSLKQLMSPKAGKADLQVYTIDGPCLRPRRVIRVLKKDPIMHMAIPHLTASQTQEGIVVYVAARRLQQDDEKVSSKSRRKAASFVVEVIRVLVPHFCKSKDVKISCPMRSIDKFKATLSISKSKSIMNTLPFKMLSATSPLPNGNDASIFVVLVRANAISIYYDQLLSSESFSPLLITMPSNNPLTACGISLNNADITCGHYVGNIRVINNILKDVEVYQIATRKEQQLHGTTSKKSKTAILPPDPLQNMITSRVHWHALPVSTIVYDSMSYVQDPLLYSGGEESVLVTWQISQGKDRPVQVHPRMALGGIVHLSSSERCDANPASGLLVYCEDNTLQLLESHNKRRLWKIQGLSSVQAGVSLQTDPRSLGQANSQLVVTGLKQAPGYIHWFDPTRERLMMSSLEVVPFNRISRNEPTERPLPTPSITGHVFGKNGDDLITIDESPSENIYVGAHEESKQVGDHGTVGTIRFWSFNSSSVQKGDSPPYHEIASMTFPHGPKNRISAISMSDDGSLACTVSCNEKSFRAGKKTTISNKSRGMDNKSWCCKYKVKVPAGLSNCHTSAKGLTFSEDNSLLVIAFDQIGTIWDTDGGRLLTTFDHSHANSNIESVQFVSPGVHQDLLLVQSRSCVSIRTPYGSNGTSNSFQGWSWSTNAKRCYINAVELVESHECVAIAVHNANDERSSIVLIDVNTGRVKESGLIESIEGNIQSLCAVGKKRVKSNWDSKTITDSPPLVLYALTSAGNLVLCTEDSSYQSKKATTTESLEILAGPRLDISSSENDRRKRPRTSSGVFESNIDITRPKRLALDVFGFGSNNDSNPSTSELPTLSSNFVKTFLGRNLQK
eukprot:CAMPEP_0116083258 /NCGR_PEP_ID=MMETSP0327-20121206/3172_1 /TAXON_ID=44447 /ORGANISM="Pseudo-nitzschia delicatissima, Strain B596" /LENGTH=913 /DNA_ID=CAMNT_0003574123 /DNA_START=280 /DNA_END=3019 /DNA_ORIENTATION=-